MAATTFEERLARIEQKRPATPEFTPTRFAGLTKPAKPKRVRQTGGVGKNLVSMATGILLGILMGVLIQGSVLPESPWGPGTEYNRILGYAGLGGLLLSLPMVLLSVYMRGRRPGFFFFSVAYAVGVIATVLI